MLIRFTRWLHTQWPAGTVEKLPEVAPDGTTNVPGVYIVGDLTGIPLLKFSADTGAKAVQHMLQDKGQSAPQGDSQVHDLIIVGAGVSGMAAALEARKHDLDFRILEASDPFSTIHNFPARKPIYTYPTDMEPAGDMRFRSDIKEGLLEELQQQTLEQGIQPKSVRVQQIRHKGTDNLEVQLADGEPLHARRVIIAIGRSGNYRRLGVPGEDLDKVSNRLHDPKDFAGKDVLVVGGGDSALEAAIAIAKEGGRVTLSYRKPEFSRPKPDNVEALDQLQSQGSPGEGRVRLCMKSSVKAIEPGSAEVQTADGTSETIPNDNVLTMIGREAPLGFFRRSGIRIRGELGWSNYLWMAVFVALCVFVYNWKAGGDLNSWFKENKWFPFNLQAADEHSLWGVISKSLTKPGFYYTLIYSTTIVLFGFARIRRRKTPYIKAQTLTLMAFQVLPLFLLPYALLPWFGSLGWFDAGFGQTVADNLFPKTEWDVHGREYWRAFGFILAWPLFIWNFFSDQPMTWWLVIGCVQTFLIIPIMVIKWGKGAYCGWICSCGALAETLGDTHRQKMPHGPGWNRLNMVGQVILWVALLMFALRIVSWTWPDSAAGGVYKAVLNQFAIGGVQLNYYWFVDVLLAGILGVGLYFWFSGRVWCRFACPLAALMHIYARFSRFRIFADKKKCISCNVCTSVCHQGIDVMNFANKGKPMQDPECVRCSACVQSCPTGVLTFGEIEPATGQVRRLDNLPASPVQMAESAAEQKPAEQQT